MTSAQHDGTTLTVGLYTQELVVFDDGCIWMPAFYGVFAEELARQAGRLVLYGHPSASNERADYQLTEPLVRGVPLLPMRPAPVRTLMPGADVSKVDVRIDELDALLVVGPSPLLPNLAKLRRVLPVVLYLVGDMSNWVFPKRTGSPIRYRLVQLWQRIYLWQQRRAISDGDVIVNAPALGKTLGARPRRLAVIPHSPVTEDMLERDADAAKPSLSRDRMIGLLCAGRIAEDKGFLETIEAMRILDGRGITTTLDIVGWELTSTVVTERLKAKALSYGISDRVRFRGYLKAGPELMDAYRRADIFVMPAFGPEGFPRTVMESLAARTPVVTTSVAGIPDWLTDGEQAILVQPKSPEALANGIERLVDSKDLAARIVTEGANWIRDFTNEKACASMVEHLRSAVLEQRVAL